MQTIKFYNGDKAPALGLGTWQLTGDTAVRSVTQALVIGYRHIDTADIYGNHEEIAKAIKGSGLKRKEIFLTTKVWRAFLEEEQVKESAKKFQDELQTDYIDLLLVHWPDSNVPIQETLGAMEELQQEGIIKNYGVSNFTIKHLKELLEDGFHPVTNQVEFHPTFYQKELKNFCDDNDIVITAYSPIGQGIDLTLEVIEELASKYNKSKSQIILNWLMQKGMIAIPRSSDEKHIKQNFDSLQWELEKNDLEKIDNIKIHERILAPSFSEFNY